LQWLEKIFDRHTKAKVGPNEYQLLIVDEHSSHVNMAFLDWAAQHRIIVHVLPAHSTHRMQPLDVGLFGPLSTAYSKELNNFMFNGTGLVSMTKRFFYTLFKPAFEKAFTEKNIINAFEKTGIYPLDPEQVLGKIRKPEPKPEPVLEDKLLQTPKTCRSVRRVQKAFQENRRDSTLELILHSNLHLAAQQSINLHIISGLTNALRFERKRRKRGRKLNLLGTNDNGPQFWSPNTVRVAKGVQAEKDANKEANRQRIVSNKAQAAANKAQKEAQKAEQALQVVARRQHALEEKTRKAEEKAKKQAQRQAKKEAKEHAKATKKAAKLASACKLKPKLPKPLKEQVVVGESSGSNQGVPRTPKPVLVKSSRTRTVRMPQRFRKTD
jgi:DDE superfamily endonuclease